MIEFDATRLKYAEELFSALVDLSPAERTAALLRECGSDLALRELVEQLLHADGDPGLDIVDRIRLKAPDDTPRRVGHYRIVDRMGEGGMGVVYEALQDHPRRAVAVKLIRMGLADDTALRRFRQEAEVLGRLEHPGIARIYEAGLAEIDPPGWGPVQRPFLAMELVRGRPIDRFATEERLDLSTALELLAKVCDAVHYAHQKGVIHRDLKPGNILVVRDSDPPHEKHTAAASPGRGPALRSPLVPQPKILDFGVARFCQNDEQATLRTNAGQLLGTLTYMSPEQLSGDPRRIDTRSDTYSLGVIGFELLCGRPPLEVRDQVLPQAIRILTDHDPPRAGALRRDLAGDVEAILARALEKQPERRYASAAEMAADIRRHLRHEPILAGPVRPVDQIRKFARRNRALVVGAALSIATLLVGLAGITTFAWRERVQAEHRRVEAARANAVVRFLREMLASVNPQSVRGADVRVRDVLDSAAERIDSGELAGQPETEAMLRATIGETYLSLGRFDQARQQLEKARALIPDGEAGAIEVTNLLGCALDGLADFAAARELHERALAGARARPGASNELVARILTDLGSSWQRAGGLAEAEAAHREALAIRRALPTASNLDRADSLVALGTVLFDRGQYAAAEPFLREGVKIRRANLPPQHPDLGHALNALGALLYHRRSLVEAEQVLQEALHIFRGTLDPRHPDLALCLNNLAMIVKIGRNPEAIPLLREAADIQTAALGPDHPEVGKTLLNLGHALYAVGERVEGERLSRRGLEIERSAFGARHQDYAFALHNVAVMLLDRDPAGAEPLLREALGIVEERLGLDHVHTVHMRDSLGVVLTSLERDEEAILLLEQALLDRMRSLAPHDGRIGLTWGHLVLPRFRSGDAAGAEAAAVQALPLLRAEEGPPDLIASVLVTLVEARLELGHAPESELEEMLVEAEEIRRTEFGSDSWQSADVQRVRGLNLLHAGRIDEAQAALRCAVEVLEAHPQATDRRAVRVLDGAQNALTQLRTAQKDRLN